MIAGGIVQFGRYNVAPATTNRFNGTVNATCMASWAIGLLALRGRAPIKRTACVMGKMKTPPNGSRCRGATQVAAACRAQPQRARYGLSDEAAKEDGSDFALGLSDQHDPGTLPASVLRHQREMSPLFPFPV